MSDPKSEMKSAGIPGSVVIGTVTKVNPFAAYLKLPDLPAVGYLHISQVSDERTDPPLADTLNEGDRIEVLLKWFDRGHERWETSRKAVLQHQRWNAGGGTPTGTRFRARVLKSSELGLVLDLDGVKGTIVPPPGFLRSAYSVLYQTGQLNPDDFIDVVADGWDEAAWQPRLRFHLGEPSNLARGAACDGTVILIHKNKIWRHARDEVFEMHDDLYVRLGGGEIASVRSKESLAIDETFPIGATIPLILGKFKHRMSLFEAYIDWERMNVPAPCAPEAGEIVDAKVIDVRPFGAICLIADRVRGLIHHSTIVQERGGDTRRHLRPGDVVRALVAEEQAGVPAARWRMQADGTGKTVYEHPPIGRLQLKFLQLVDRTRDTEATESSDLIDLRATRRLGRPSGFERDQNFRWNVLDAFDHTCCVCGARHVFGKASAMEAAHIIPRARRGADTTQNSLCLCSLHHWAFDKGFFTIDEYFCVVVSRQISELGEPDSPIARYHGNKIHVTDPTIISVGAIEWHRQNIFLDE